MLLSFGSHFLYKQSVYLRVIRFGCNPSNN